MHQIAAASVVGFTHFLNSCLTVSKSLNRCILTCSRCGHDTKLMEFSHLFDEFSRSAGITKTPSCHGEGLGKSVQKKCTLLHSGKTCDGYMWFIIVGKLCINLVRYYNKIIFDYNLSNFFEIPARHDGAGGIVWKWQDKDLGALSDRSTQVISSQTKFVLGFEVNEFRYAVCHNCTRFIGNKRRLRDQNLITRLEHGTHRKVNRLTAAHSHKNLCFGIIGNMIFILYIFADLLAEFQKTCV